MNTLIHDYYVIGLEVHSSSTEILEKAMKEFGVTLEESGV
jgi:hypothetical protein